MMNCLGGPNSRRTPTRIALTIFGLLLLLSAATTLRAQSTYGRHFLVPFPDTSHVRTEIVNPLLAEARLIIFSRSRASVTLKGDGFQRSLILLPDTSVSISLYDPLGRPPRIFTDTVFLPVRSAVEVISDVPVAVVGYFVTIDGAEAFTALPVESWGREYMAVSRRNQLFTHVAGNEENLQIDNAPPELLLVASEDATVVTVTPIAGALGYAGGTYSLDAGEVLLVETARPPSNLDSATRDLTGARISSNRPVGVISGNTRTEGGLGGLSGTLTGNSLRNTAIEWLSPLSAHGTTFVYTPLFRDGSIETPELVRVVATSPGTTTVVNSNGSFLRSIQQGSHTEFNSLELASSGVTGPFALNTDRPAEVMVIGGGYVKRPATDSLPSNFAALYTWGPAMSELVPHERWISSGRFRAPDYPRNLRHWITIAADSGATVLLDGRSVTFDPAPVRGTPFRFARIEVASGDHSLHSLSGRFSAIACGQARGYEAFEPLAPRGDDDPVEGIAHVSKYLEAIAASYAYPVPGTADGAVIADSLRLTRVERCSETIVTAERTGPLWMVGPLAYAVDPASRNLGVTIDTLYTGFIPSGYRIRFSPVDPARDATGGVLLRNMLDSAWYVPYSYRAEGVEIAPDPIEILGARPGVARALALTLTNVKPFTMTVLSVRLKNGTTGFTLSGGGVPKPLAAGGSYSLTLSFTGADFSTRSVDTLVIETDCRTFTLPVLAQTAPPDPAPVPLVTGYDWGRRRVGTSHDTLSFLSNAGDRDYDIDRVEIVSDPAGAFALVSPDWRSIGTVPSGGRRPAGIRFTPPSAGTFQAEIVLTTTGGLSVRATLEGSGADPGIEASDVDLLSVCRTEPLDSAFTITNTGSLPVTVLGVSAPLGGMLGLSFDTAAIGLPRVLAVGEILRIPFAISPRRVGSWRDSVIVHTDADEGDSIAVISARVAECSGQGLEVDDHDFGTLFVTLSRDGFVTLENSGASDVTISSMEIIDDAESSFMLTGPTSSFTVPAGDTVHVHARFTPRSAGARSALIEFTTDLGILHSRLTGIGATLQIPAFIGRGYHALYGDTLSIAVELDSAVGVELDSIAVTIGYDSSLLAYLGLREESIAAGWSDRGEREPDSLRLHLARRSRPGSGVLVMARFLARFSLRDSTELPLRIESPVPYIEFIERPGLFRADPICGLNQRLYVMSAYRFVLEQNIPNPSAGATSIYFEIPFDSRTSLTLYDLLGREVLSLVDGELAAGGHTVTIDAGRLAAGAYWYRLVSGDLVATRRLVIE
jgi:hypothetical protein